MEAATVEGTVGLLEEAILEGGPLEGTQLEGNPEDRAAELSSPVRGLTPTMSPILLAPELRPSYTVSRSPLTVSRYFLVREKGMV